MNTTPAEREQIVGLTLRSILNSIPTFGPILTDVLFEYRNKVRQERINSFVRSLEGGLSNMNIDPATLKNEDTLGLLEGIFKKVAESQSEQKRNAFRNILFHGIENISEIDLCEIFSDILLSVRTKELEILIEHRKYLINGKGPLVERNHLKSELRILEDRPRMGIPEVTFPEPYISSYVMLTPKKKTQEDLKHEIEFADRLFEQYTSSCTAEKFGVNKDEYKYFLQNLLSKGLLSDDGAGTVGLGSIEVMSLTNFGAKFLSFI